MGKYRINENPDYSVVPVLELIPGQRGVVLNVGIYSRNSVLHLVDRRAVNVSNGHSPLFASYRDLKLSDLEDGLINDFALAKEIPLEELTELRELERNFRRIRNSKDTRG